uniref:PPUP9110 n=1 Tax=Poeciliopsis prolifica TaxID=188132 RepID=A0A0S7EJF8_9TELE
MEDKDVLQPSGQFSPVLPCLRTIRADNIIIIEQDRKGSNERRARWREAERETSEEDQQGKRGMKMDLREILAGGGSVTEIRASEVLIIKPSVSTEERTAGRGKSREDGEGKSGLDLTRDTKSEMSCLREKRRTNPGVRQL